MEKRMMRGERRHMKRRKTRYDRRETNDRTTDDKDMVKARSASQREDLKIVKTLLEAPSSLSAHPEALS